MNDLEKAQALLFNRKIKLKNIADSTGIPYPTIRSYIVNPNKMKTAAWITIYTLAQLYEEVEK